MCCEIAMPPRGPLLIESSFFKRTPGTGAAPPDSGRTTVGSRCPGGETGGSGSRGANAQASEVIRRWPGGRECAALDAVAYEGVPAAWVAVELPGTDAPRF